MSDPLSALLTQVLGALLQSAFDAVFGAAGRLANNRRLARHLVDPATLLGRVGPEVATLRDGELANVPDHELTAAVHAVRDSFALATPIDVPRFHHLLRDADAFADHVAEQAAAVLASAGLSEGGQRAYTLLLHRCSTALVRQVNGTPALAALVQSMSINDVERATAQIIAMLTDVLGRDRVEQALFEQRYTDHVAATMRTFELFGVSSGRAPIPHAFDRYYVSLALTRRHRDGDERRLTGAGTDGAHAITGTRRVLLQGGAGAGKTTFLTRLRLVAARGARTENAQWPDSVPFFVPLRQFSDGEFPGLEDLVAVQARALVGEKPDRWVSSVFREGRGLLLVDGMDELTSARRAEALEWLEGLLAGYPGARYVVSSRPSAVDHDWAERHDFAVFDLLPLSDNGVRDFVANWHEAAREREREPLERDWLAEAERTLLGTLAARPELRRIASSPLLCGLVCALHREKGMTLPMDRRSLFDAALELLLWRWDEERGVGGAGPWPRGKEEQFVLLQRVAASMVVNGEVILPRETAATRFGQAGRGLRSASADPAELLQQALERTGLLREPYQDRVQFVHRTFRDYLAAREFVDAGMTGLLVEHAADDAWREVVVMAVGHARPKERADLLTRLLDRANSERRREPRLADRLDLVAAVCLEEVQVIDPDDVRLRVQEAVRRLIPPTDLDNADALARAGSFVLDLLPGPDVLSPEQAAYVVHTAAMIGGEGAWERIAPFAEHHQAMVVDELLSGWRLAPDPEEYAHTVLSQVDFGDLPVPVRRWERARELRHFRLLRAVRGIGDMKPLDPFAQIPNLRSLELVVNTVVRDLDPLAECRTLRRLELFRCEALRDLSPLARTGVRELTLRRVRGADLGSLRGAPVEVLRIQHAGLEAGLHELPSDLPLRVLVLENPPDRRSLLGVERWRTLESVEVPGTPSAGEVSALASLPALRTVVVRRPGAVDRLAELARAAWPALRVLEVHDLPDADAERRARELLRPLPGVEVRVFRG